jgi:hypothetical protein
MEAAKHNFLLKGFLIKSKSEEKRLEELAKARKIKVLIKDKVNQH